MNCGEAWLLSGLEGQNSVVCNGDFAGDELNDLIETFMGDLVGDEVFNRYGERFPLLIKIIDPLDYLSIQVHPDDELAQKIGLHNGKTEMWYVMHAEKDANLASGFNRDITPQEFENAIKDKSLGDMLNYEKVQNDDVFFIPARKIHALGAGCMVAEIQQTSDTSYRVYDCEDIFESIHFGNTYYDANQPWKTRVDNIDECKSTIAVCTYLIANIANRRV